MRNVLVVDSVPGASRPLSDDDALSRCREAAHEFIGNRRAQLAEPTKIDVMAYLTRKRLIAEDQFARLRPLIATLVVSELDPAPHL